MQISECDLVSHNVNKPLITLTSMNTGMCIYVYKCFFNTRCDILGARDICKNLHKNLDVSNVSKSMINSTSVQFNLKQIH